MDDTIVKRDLLGVRGAVFSRDNVYRYMLWRTSVVPSSATLLFVMLNPSTATHLDDDPTIRKCMGFAREHSYTRVEVVNLFALRSRNPKVLKNHPDPVGPHNDEAIISAVACAARVVVAWGTNVPKPMANRISWVLESVCAKADVYALRVTKGGEPEHPLFVPYSSPLVLYRAASVDAPRVEGRP